MGVFEKLMKKMAEYYARECGGIGWKWQAMDSKHSAAPLGGEKTGKNPTDRGKSGAKINLLVDGRGAPISIVLTGANRHDNVSAIGLIVSVVTKSPAHKEQHLCADKAYDADDLRGFLASAGYVAHIKVNPRRKDFAEGGGAEHPPNDDGSSKRNHPGEAMDSGADDLVVSQASQPAHSLGEEGRKLAGACSSCLRPHLAQLGGFRIESKSARSALRASLVSTALCAFSARFGP
jgi:transposase